MVEAVSLEEQLVIAQNCVVLMFGLLLLLSALVLSQPSPEFKPKPKAPAVEFCKLHACPLTECVGQHGSE